MDYKKIVLYVLLLITGLALWNAWISDNLSMNPPQTQEAAETLPQGAGINGSNAVGTALPPGIAHQVNVPGERLIHVKTDVLNVAIDKEGGNIVRAQLLKFPESLSDATPLTLLDDQSDSLYLAQSGLITANQNGPLQPLHYQSTETQYVMNTGMHQLVVNLTAVNPEGLQIQKTYTFSPGQYAIKVMDTVKNPTAKTWTGSFYAQLKKRNTAEKKHFLGFRAYTGAAMYTPDKPYTKLSFTDLAAQNLNVSVRGGWLAMQQQYFLSAWVPDQTSENVYFSRIDDLNNPSNIYTMGVVMPQFQVAPQGLVQQSATLYIGPEEASQLETLAPYLDRTVDYGWLWFLSVPIFKVLSFIHHWIGNWGWSIVLVTILIKLLFFKLSEMSAVSMAKTRQVQPKIQALKAKYGDDRQALGQATMQLYREEKINPLSGCLPMLIQIPFFIALYYVLMESVELRQAPFIFWIHDLSLKDPFYILPVLMVLSMIAQQKMSPAPMDEMQAKMMLVMPIVFGLMFISFPAGLVLYWLTNNLISIAQQWFIMRRYDQTHKPQKQSGSFKKKRA